MVYLVFRYVSIWLISKRLADAPFQKARLQIAEPCRSNLLLFLRVPYVFVREVNSTAARLWECACALFVFTAAAVAAQALSPPLKKGAAACSCSGSLSFPAAPFSFNSVLPDHQYFYQPPMLSKQVNLQKISQTRQRCFHQNISGPCHKSNRYLVLF